MPSRGRGLVGRITEAYSTAGVSGRNIVGGLVGSNMSGSVSDCYSAGAVDGNDVVGGLVGSNGDLVTDCYSTGPVTGAGYVGGLVGDNWDLVNCSFWDIQTSGQTSSAGGTGKTTAEMQTTSTFLTWAACGPIWTINEGQDYPRLAWENAQGQTIFVQSYGGGTGTAEDPYLIYTAEDLNAIGLVLCHADKHFKLMADIDLSGFDGKDGRPVFNMIGPGQWHYSEYASYLEGIAFDGVFDGNGHTISHLTVTGDSNLGMFGYLSSEAEIRDLSVVDVNVTGSGSNLGALAGYNGGYLIRCSSTGIVSGSSSVGGLVGANGGIVTGCFSTVAATAQGDYAGSVGGLAGNNNGTIDECYSTGAASGQSSIGGLVGNNDGSITTSYSTVVVNGDSSVGGLVGNNYGGVTSCYSRGAVSGNSDAGGLVGSGSPTGVMHSVWDIETSVLAASAGGVGLTTAEMMELYMLGLNGFADDPGWILDAGRDYPRLAWEGTTGTIIPEPSVDWLKGQGNEAAPYQIDTAGQLVLLCRASLLWDRHFVLGADIDLDPKLSDGRVFGEAVIPVFSGVFDGNGHAIRHLTIEGGGYLGLFGCIADPNSEIRNVGLIDPNVKGTNYVGALVGNLGEGIVADCFVRAGRVSGGNTVGGLVGSGSNIIGCFVQDVEVSAEDTFFGNAGGLVGSGGHGLITDCHVVGGTISASGQVGGLAASTGGATISRCSASANVEASADQNFWVLFCTAGGLVGSNGGSFAGSGGTIESCCATGNISQSGAIDDFFGDLFPSGVGGLVGINSGEIRQSYATGAVTADVSAGGLVGAGWGSVAQCYSSGAVSSSGNHAGGLVGDGYPTKVTYSLWDVETSGLSVSAGGVGLTTSEMMNPYMPALNGFANDPNWVLDAGRDYPRLAWEGTPGNIIPEANIDWLAGEGTVDSPYRIDTADQLILSSRAAILWNRNFVLGEDIDLDPALPGRRIFRQAFIQEFTGVFDGAGHVISNLTIEGSQNLGLFGSLTAEAQVRNIGLVHVNVAGSDIHIGGLAGENRGNIVACYSSGSVSGTYDVGGLVGSNEGSIAASSSSGTVSGTDSSVGGLTGWNNGTIDSSYSSSAVSGTGQVGGLVGSNSGSVANSYSSGSVSGTNSVGGLAGVNYNGLISYSYSTASVSGTNYVGGFAGNSYQGNISLSFWDTQTSGQTESAGGTGKTTAEMQTASTFLDAGWDFVDETSNGTDDIWWILEGHDYPRLWWELIPEN